MADSQPAAGDGGQRSNLMLRIMAALVLAPLAIAAAWLGGWLWHAVATLTAIGLYVEWTFVIGLKADRRLLAAGVVALLVLSAALAWRGASLGAPTMLAGMAAVAAVAPAVLRVWAVTGFVYAALAMTASIMLRADAQSGFMAIVFVFAVVWASDIFGYFVGRAVGGPKLWPRVSPKKTWAGAIGGFAGSIVAAIALAAVGGGSAVALGVVGAALSVVSQLGDLFESAVKRRFDVKDSSHLIPGHGGLMDRLDGYVAVVVAAALIGAWRAGPDAAGRGLLLW